MANIFGALRLTDSDYVFSSTAGQRVIWDEAQRYIAEQNAAIAAITAAFVERVTEGYTERYKLPGGGMLQRRGGLAQSAATKLNGGWDVSFPLEEYGDQIAGDVVSMAYMSVGDLSRHIESVTTRDRNTVRYEILRALLNGSARTWTDPLAITADLTIQPLANGDTVLYPPVAGTTTEATENHYLVSGYTTANISNTNDPIAGIAVPELEQHFGMQTGGSAIAVFAGSVMAAKLTTLSQVVDVPDRFISPGDDTAVPVGMPMLPGRTIGRHQAGAWLQEWPFIPPDYILAIHLEAPAPLVQRRDPMATGLPMDLALVSQDAETPFNAAHWRHRFGYGVGNRLNGVVVQCKASGNYDTPSAYA